MGSKNRIAKEIVPILLKDRKDGQWYVEPFVGGANLIDKVSGNRIASDNNKYLIEMWKGLQQNRERPCRISKELYTKAKNEYKNGTNIDFDDFLIGWMGSFNGKFYNGGYSGHCAGKTKRDYISEQIRNTEKQLDNIKGVIFSCCDYNKLTIPNDSIIYCDIPYKNTTQYSTSKDFNHNEFWQWCRDMTNKGHQVFISEYQAPNDFTCIWEKVVVNSMSTKKTYKPIEKLFVYQTHKTKFS